MAAGIELSENSSHTEAWSLPEKLPGNPHVTLRSAITDYDLTPSETSRVNFGVAEAARVIYEGGAMRPGFGYSLEPVTRNVYSVRHLGGLGQSPVEAMITRIGPVSEPQIVLVSARRR
jgi:hypothetical protein